MRHLLRLILGFLSWTVKLSWLHLRRTFTSQLARLPLTEAENTRLEQQGIHDQSTRRFLAWRRSVSATLTVATLFHAISYSLGTRDLVQMAPQLWSSLGLATLAIRCALLFLMPLTGFLAFWLWDRPRTTSLVLVIGWLLSFLIPIVLSFVPAHLLFAADFTQDPVGWTLLKVVAISLDEPILAAQPLATRDEFARLIDVGGALAYAIILLPAFLALLPGILISCVRLKGLFPEAIVPGWFLLAFIPFHMLTMILLLVLSTPFISYPLLVTILLLLTAPLPYLLVGPMVVRVVVTPRDSWLLRTAQRVSTGLVLSAFVVLLSYLASVKFTVGEETFRLVGLEEFDVLRPWDLLAPPVEYLGRSLFTLLTLMHLLLRVELSVRRQVSMAREQDGRPPQCRGMLELAELLEGRRRK